MVINDNLVNVGTFDIEATDNTYENRIISLPEKLESGAKYTFSAKVKQSKSGSGKCTFLVRRRGMSNSVIIHLPKDKFVYTFVYDKEKQDEILIYPDIQGQTNGVGAKFYDIKLEKGDKMTPYIPNENAIETPKRQYFIGGVFQEVYPLS